jgi:hypothetical protein
MRSIKIGRVTPDEVDAERLADVAREFATWKNMERQGETERKGVGSRLLPMMQELGIRIVKVKDFDEFRDATVSEKTRTNTQIDAARLKRALGARVYNKLTTRVLDEAKVEAAISKGEIDANTVASCMDEYETPYLEVRFTKKKEKK